MPDKKLDNNKKEKLNDIEEMQGMYDNQYHINHMCPMISYCPMSFQCPMAGGQMIQKVPGMTMPYMPNVGMRIKDWYDDWDEFSEDSSFEFDSDDYESPEKYYKKHYKKHKYPFFWPPFFQFYR